MTIHLLRLCKDDPAAGGGAVADDLADGGDADIAAFRVLDADHGRNEVGAHVRFLEREIRALHFAVEKAQVFAVAKGLRADDLAVDERKPVRIPTQIFAPYHAVAHGHVFSCA